MTRPTLAGVLSGTLLLVAAVSHASDFPRVDRDIEVYDDHVAALDAAFHQVPTNPSDEEWVKAKLTHMAEVDQYTREYFHTPYEYAYSEAEKEEFDKRFKPRALAVDTAHTTDLKALLEIYDWFTVSEFGEVADGNAWLLVQHADQDPAFQQSVLDILSELWQEGETSPANYAYLFDRVAASYHDPSKRRLQRYGTQGTCVGPGTWQPLPTEDPEHLDTRRATVGLGPEADYIELFKDICHS